MPFVTKRAIVTESNSLIELKFLFVKYKTHINRGGVFQNVKTLGCY